MAVWLAWTQKRASQPDRSQITLNKKSKNRMLYTLAVILIILWLLGMVSSYTMGGFIHILLVVALIMVLVNVIGGRSRSA
jgi:hypothetical protein